MVIIEIMKNWLTEQRFDTMAGLVVVSFVGFLAFAFVWVVGFLTLAAMIGSFKLAFPIC